MPSRFFIALIPPPEIQAYAATVIQDLRDRYRLDTAKAPPHVTLQPPFLWELGRVAELTQQLEAIASQQPTVPIELAGFGAFAPRVLYVQVVKTPELLALQAALMTRLEATLGIVDPQSKRRPFTPHMTVASRNVTRQSFQQAWADLKERSPQFSFTADRLTLLLHDGQRWQTHSAFPLLSGGSANVKNS